jgi:hypothetical protein
MRILIGVMFSAFVAFVAYLLGAGVPIAWLTFLFFCLFAGMAQVMDRLWDIERKVNVLLSDRSDKNELTGLAKEADRTLRENPDGRC